VQNAGQSLSVVEGLLGAFGGFLTILVAFQVDLSSTVTRTGILAAFAVIAIIVIVVKQAENRTKGRDGYFPTRKETYDAYTNLNQKNDMVFAVSKFPILILPDERNSDDGTEAYDIEVKKRLEMGGKRFELHYVFDLDGFKDRIRSYMKSTDSKWKIDQVRVELAKLAKHDNLELKCAKTGAFYSLAIGGTKDVFLAFRETPDKPVKVGFRIHSDDLGHIMKSRFLQLTSSPDAMDAKASGFLDKVIQSVTVEDGNRPAQSAA